MRSVIKACLFGVGLGLSFAPVLVLSELPATFADPLQQARYTALLEEIRCLVCQNQSLADSKADLAGDLRREIQRLIGSGASDEQVSAFLVARYGDFVLYRPPLKPVTFLLWSGPLWLLIGGALVTLRLVRRRAHLVSPQHSAEQRRRVAQLLRDGGGNQQCQ